MDRRPVDAQLVAWGVQ